MRTKTSRTCKPSPIPVLADSESVRWYHRDKNGGEWVLEVDIICGEADRSITARFVGTTKAEALDEFEGRMQ